MEVTFIPGRNTVGILWMSTNMLLKLLVFFGIDDMGIWKDLYAFKDVDVSLIQKSSHVDFYMYSKNIMEDSK